MSLGTIGTLGTVCVLDSDQIKIGAYIELDKQVLVVERTEDEQVFLRAIAGMELIRFRATQHRRLIAGSLVMFALITLLILVILLHR